MHVRTYVCIYVCINSFKIKLLGAFNSRFVLIYIDVKQTIKQLVKRSARPTKADTHQGRMPYEPKKAPPFSLQQLLQMRTYCLKTIEVG